MGQSRKHFTHFLMRKTEGDKEFQGGENAKESHSASMKSTKMGPNMVSTLEREFI